MHLGLHAGIPVYSQLPKIQYLLFSNCSGARSTDLPPNSRPARASVPRRRWTAGGQLDGMSALAALRSFTIIVNRLFAVAFTDCCFAVGVYALVAGTGGLFVDTRVQHCCGPHCCWRHCCGPHSCCWRHCCCGRRQHCRCGPHSCCWRHCYCGPHSCCWRHCGRRQMRRLRLCSHICKRGHDYMSNRTVNQFLRTE